MIGLRQAIDSFLAEFKLEKEKSYILRYSLNKFLT